MKPIQATELSREQIAKVLRTKDDYKKVAFAGAEREFFLGGISFELASEEGVDLGEVLQVLGDADGAAVSGEAMERYTTALAWLLYVGMKPFGAELTPAEVKLHVGAMSEREMERLVGAIGMDEAAEAMDEAVGSASGNAPAGNAEAGAPSPASPEPASGNGATAPAATPGAS